MQTVACIEGQHTKLAPAQARHVAHAGFVRVRHTVEYGMLTGTLKQQSAREATLVFTLPVMVTPV